MYAVNNSQLALRKMYRRVEEVSSGWGVAVMMGKLSLPHGLFSTCQAGSGERIGEQKDRSIADNEAVSV